MRRPEAGYSGQGREPPHLTERELAGFLDGDLQRAERERVVEHLDECAMCRRELVEMRQLVDSYASPPERGLPPARPKPLVRRWRLAAGAAAALAAGLVAILVLPRSAIVDQRSTERAGEPAASTASEGTGRIGVVSPTEGAAITPGTTVFAWRTTGADVYRFTLLAESGEPVWTHETGDTTLVIPSAAPAPSGEYFWRVDAIADGITATTGVHRIRLDR